MKPCNVLLGQTWKACYLERNKKYTFFFYGIKTQHNLGNKNFCYAQKVKKHELIVPSQKIEEISYNNCYTEIGESFLLVRNSMFKIFRSA